MQGPAPICGVGFEVPVKLDGRQAIAGFGRLVIGLGFLMGVSNVRKVQDRHSHSSGP